MGFWKSVKNVGKSIGKIGRQVAPFASLVPGVGTLASVALGAGGSLLEGKGIKGAIKGGLSGYGGSKMIGGLTGGAGIKGIGAAVAKQGGYKAAGLNLLKSKLGIPATSGNQMPGGPDVIETDTHYNPDGSIASQTPFDPNVGNANIGGKPAGGGGWMDLLKGGLGAAGTWAKNNPELLLAGGTAIMGAKGSADANKARDRALGRLNADYESRAPYRNLALKNLTTEDPRIASLGSIFNNGRPYQAAR